jgi:hypothetical protein
MYRQVTMLRFKQAWGRVSSMSRWGVRPFGVLVSALATMESTTYVVEGR